MEILSLEEAAKLFQVCKETIRQLAISKQIRGRKVGRPWRFYKHELIEDIGNLSTKGMTSWESTKEKTAYIGGFQSKRQMEKDYEEAVKQLTKKKQNC